MQGTYTLKAVATDDRGATAVSELVVMVVKPDDGRKRVAIIQNFARFSIQYAQKNTGDDQSRNRSREKRKKGWYAHKVE